MNTVSDAISAVQRKLDDSVRGLPKSEYLEVLEELSADFEARLDCVREEMDI